MRFAQLLLATLMLLPLGVDGRTKRDTVYTTDGDRIILTYDITSASGETTIRFLGQQKKLGSRNEKYSNKLDKVAVMFFDRTGNYGGDVSISNMVPEAFMIPTDVQYRKSQDGFYLVQSEPTLSFSVKKNTEINIPIYLAYKPKKGKYILFGKSAGIRIPLTKKSAAVASSAQVQTINESVTSTAEIEADNTTAIKVLESMNISRDLISEATSLPFSENLIDEINYLRQKRREVTDKALVEAIAEVMDQYEAKKRLLEEKSASELKAQEIEAEQKAQREAMAIKAENDSIAAAQQIAVEKEKKRNMWMIVGGFILTILAFVGNQVFQTIRSRRNQLNMLTMQQNIANRAEAEARRRARNAIRGETNKLVNGVKQKTSSAIRKKVTIDVNGKSKKASI